MAISAADIVPLSQARANLSELADEVKAGAEKIITKNGESCLWRDYLMLYMWDGKIVHLLSTKHHRQLSFDLNSVWSVPGPGV
jgi:hypothetical protein